MTVGDIIKKRREELGMTTYELAELIGVSHATVSRYESGYINSIKSGKIQAIAEALRTTPKYLMGWTDDPAMSTEDTELLRFYHKLNALGRKHAIIMIKGMLKEDEYRGDSND